MIIKALSENTAVSDEFGSEHGLSLYIETAEKKFLFDVGASPLFLKNAEKLGVNIADIDFLVISHGHYDHGGGLRAFLQKNSDAVVYLHHMAFEKHYAVRPNGEMEYIGLEEDLKKNSRIVPTLESTNISEGIRLFSNVSRREPVPASNNGLLAEHDGLVAADSFSHEQNLVIEEGGKTLLVTGCAHNGIVNILEHFNYLTGHMPDYVIGGFHLYSRASGGNEDHETLDGISKYLMGTKAKFFTCHCTGLVPYSRLKAGMGDRIDYLSAGSTIII